MTLGMMASDVEQRIDFEAMRKHKRERIQIQLREKDLGAVLCFDPDNVRPGGGWLRGANVATGTALAAAMSAAKINRLLLSHPTPIQANMHFALETFAGDGDDGARIESQVIVTKDGHKVITRWPCEELMVCSPR